MQLFGLVNMLLNSTPSTATRDLGIARYAVVPLSPNSGLIGWVPNCDTLHALIREHRDAHKVPLNLEHRLMLAMAPDYDHLPLVNKVSNRQVISVKTRIFFSTSRRSLSLSSSPPPGLAGAVFAVMKSTHNHAEPPLLTARRL